MASTISAGTTSGTAIAITGDTTGNLAFTTQAGANTITVPNSTGTLLTTGSPQSGGVIQVVQAGSNGSSTTSASLVDMGLSASITPKFSTSKILAIINGVARINNFRAGFAIVRNSTTIVGMSELVGNGSAVVTLMPYYLNVLDSPATTSSITYKVQFNSSGGNTLYTSDGGVNYAGNLNYITLMEIAA